MTGELLAALRIVVAAHPVGSSVQLPRELALELLDGAPAEAAAPTLERDLTCREAGQVLGRHDSTIRAAAERGEFAGAYRQNGREWRIPPAAVRAYQAAQQAGKTTVKTTVAGQGRKILPLNAWRSTSLDRARAK